MLAVILVVLALRRAKRQWPHVTWLWLFFLGAFAAFVVRVVASTVVRTASGNGTKQTTFDLTQAATEDLPRQAFASFGLIGPVTVFSLAAIVWGVLGAAKDGGYARWSGAGSRELRKDTDAPLCALVAAAGFTTARILIIHFVDHAQLGTGIRLGLATLGELSIAACWGYGLGRSATDGSLGGSPFGRYALGMMVLRGGVDVAGHLRGAVPLAVQLFVGIVLSFTVGLAVRSTVVHRSRPTGLSDFGSQSIREFTRSQLEQGGVRPFWILLGTLGSIGGIVCGLAAAVAIGWVAHVDFGEIDRGGAAAEYAALLLILGMLVSFPVTAGITSLAGGGRSVRGRAYVLEAGLSAVLALGATLVVIGVLAPVAIALGVACAPIAFVLAAVGAWIVSGRKM